MAEMLHKFLKAPGGQQQLLACFIHRVAGVKETVTRLRKCACAGCGTGTCLDMSICIQYIVVPAWPARPSAWSLSEVPSLHCADHDVHGLHTQGHD